MPLGVRDVDAVVRVRVVGTEGGFTGREVSVEVDLLLPVVRRVPVLLAAAAAVVGGGHGGFQGVGLFHLVEEP